MRPKRRELRRYVQDRVEREHADLEVERAVPVAVRIASEWSWRLIVIALAVAGFCWAIVQLHLVVIPFLIALLLSALLVPFSNFLQSHRWPRGLAVLVSLLLTFAVIAGLVFLVVIEIKAGAPELVKRSEQRYTEAVLWLHGPPFNLSDADVKSYLDQGLTALQKSSSVLLNGVAEVGTTAGHVLTGVLITFFTTIFMLLDGERIFGFVVGLFPRRARAAVTGAAAAGWVTLRAFIRVQLVVAFTDALGIAFGSFVLGLFNGGFPMLVPIAVAVFLGAFVPIVGAVVTGALAVFVALVFMGPVQAIIMLGIVVLVQQIESHVLHPFLTGSVVRVHPLAVVLGVGAGGFLAGIVGTFFAVPFIATMNRMVKFIAAGSWKSESDEAEELHEENRGRNDG